MELRHGLKLRPSVTGLAQDCCAVEYRVSVGLSGGSALDNRHFNRCAGEPENKCLCVEFQ